MFGLAEPAWLFALLLIPLIRWLHRWHAPLTFVPVSAVFLWPKSRQLDSGGNAQQPPDPAWKRRALIVALLVLALAQPWRQNVIERITVWVDDSLSMQTREDGRTRLASGLAQLERAINSNHRGNVTLRSITDPAAIVSATDADAFSAQRWLFDREVTMPLLPPALLPADTLHWLVTDGASAAIRDWAGHATLQRVFQVGSTTENVAVTRLAARRNPDKPGATNILIELSNLGRTIAERQILLTTGTAERVLLDERLSLAPGEAKRLQQSIEFDTNTIAVTSQPSDALSLDDSLVLDVSTLLPAKTYIDSACAQLLRAALVAHPGLTKVASATDAEIQVSCSDEPRTAHAMLKLHAGISAPLQASPIWLAAAGELQELTLRAEWLAATVWPPDVGKTDTVLMRAGDRPLIIRRANDAATMESTLDLSMPAFQQQPEYPILLAGLINIVLGRDVLDPVVTVANAASASSIAPFDVVVVDAYKTAPVAQRMRLGDVFLLLALIVLGLDIVLLARPRRELQIE